MRTNFLRSTILLILILIVPIIISCIRTIGHYGYTKSDWHYILALTGIVLLGILFISGISVLVYSLLLAKRRKKDSR